MKRFAVLQLSGCAGCEVALLNAEAWVTQYKLVYMPLVVSAEDVPEVDVLLISGGVRTDEDLYKLRRAVKNAQQVIAVGTCAISGGVANLGDRDEVRALFLAEANRPHVPRLLPKSHPVDAFVAVDLYVPGCPPTSELFMAVLTNPHDFQASKVVCQECGRQKLKDVKPFLRLRRQHNCRWRPQTAPEREGAVSLFIFTMPDRLGVDSIFDVDATKLDGDALAGVAARALQVRQAGTHLITLAGGQFIHPVKAVVGGVTGGIDAEAASAMRAELADALPVACALFDTYWNYSVALSERLGTWGDDAPTCYLTAVSGTHPNYYGDFMRLMDCEGGDICAQFPAREFRAFLTVEEAEYSCAAQTSYQGNVLRANSLARANIIDNLETPCANDYLQRFHCEFGQPAHAILLYDLARGIEMVYAIERAIEILSEPLDGAETRLPYEPRDGVGYGLVEAPRGPLIHHYRIENGLIAQAEFVIPTVHNVLAIERALRVAAERYITPERVNLELERAVGRVVRAFDPCIACATH